MGSHQNQLGVEFSKEMGHTSVTRHRAQSDKYLTSMVTYQQPFLYSPPPIYIHLFLIHFDHFLSLHLALPLNILKNISHFPTTPLKHTVISFLFPIRHLITLLPLLLQSSVWTSPDSCGLCYHFWYLLFPTVSVSGDFITCFPLSFYFTFFMLNSH